MTKGEMTDEINSAIKNQRMIFVEIKDKYYDDLFGFPISVSDEILVMSVISDFRFCGIKAIRLSEIECMGFDKDIGLYEKICREESLDKKHCNIISDIKFDTFKDFFEHFGDKECFIYLECKDNALPVCVGFAEKMNDEKVWFNNFDGDGRWCEKADEIYLKDIVSAVVNDNYSQMYYKYMKKYKMFPGDENVRYCDEF